MSAQPLLLLLETATGVCSVALSQGQELLSIRTSTSGREHASMLAVYIQQVMQESGKDLKNIDGVVVSKGPGSYTGLRIGVAGAKGICFSLGKPLLMVDTPLAMAFAYVRQYRDTLPPDALLIPVIDARRMEVYGAAIDTGGAYVEAVRAEILHPFSFITDTDRPCFVFGDAAPKCVEVYRETKNVHVDISFNLSATGLLSPGLRAYHEQQFTDIARAEPFYLKEFVAGVKKEKG